MLQWVFHWVYTPHKIYKTALHLAALMSWDCMPHIMYVYKLHSDTWSRLIAYRAPSEL